MATRTCARCGKEGTTQEGFARCSRCKDVYYCGTECQKLHWTQHKSDCLPPDKKPQPPAEDVVVGYVECETYQDCKNYLIKHPELINKQVSEEMYEKGFLVLKTHPPQFGMRFLRNAQILQYLLDLRKISGGQQDISLFFARILDPSNKEYVNNFDNEWKTLVQRILTRHKERAEKEKVEKEAAEKAQPASSAPVEEAASNADSAAK